MRILLIGGTGFIGTQITRGLLSAGHETAIFHRGRTGAGPPGARTYRGDRSTPAALAAALEEYAPTAVVDTVAYTGPAMRILVGALPPSVRHLVVLSSGDVYQRYDAFRGITPSATARDPLDEDAPLRQRLHPYRDQATGPDDLRFDYEKIEVEAVARESPVPVSLLRLPMVYGPGDPQRRVGGYLDKMMGGARAIGLHPDEAAWRCTRGYAEDVAHAVILAATGVPADQTFNVGEAEAVTELEWVRLIAHAIGWQGRVSADPASAMSRPANWRADLVTSTARIRNQLGYVEPVGRAEGLRRTVAAYPGC